MTKIRTRTIKTPKDLERESLAEDIKTYLNRGGAIRRVHHGETALGGNLNKVWERTLRSDPTKK